MRYGAIWGVAGRVEDAVVAVVAVGGAVDSIWARSFFISGAKLPCGASFR